MPRMLFRHCPDRWSRFAYPVRKAIVDGLAESIAELKEANVGMSEEQIMSILLTNQYLDTLNTFAAKGNQTLFLPNNPNGVDDIRTQILSALKTDNKN